MRPFKPARDESGIALFMVLAAMTLLSVIVTEFTTVAQVNSRMAFDSTDTVKAHYLAKTGLKISLLRLKAYQELKALAANKSAGVPTIPKSLLDQIWSFPFTFPIPTNIPGLSPFAKEEIEKFQKDSNLAGRFTSIIEGESDKVNLNSMLSFYAPAPNPSASPSASPSPGSSNPNTGAFGAGITPRGGTPSPNPSNGPYSPEEARKEMRQMLAQILDDKFKADPDFALEYKDLSLDELFDNLLGWIDYTYQPQNRSGKQLIPYKRAPLYSMSELHMVYPIDDGVYDLLSQNLTTNLNTSLNPNTLKEPLLRALLPGITDEEVRDFFKFRDDPDQDNSFKDEKDFWDYVGKNVGAFRGSQLDELKKKLEARGIRVAMEDESFKITVVAEVNKASRILEAWVSLAPPKTAATGGSPTGRTGGRPRTPTPRPSSAPEESDGSAKPGNGSGLRILFMRES